MSRLRTTYAYALLVTLLVGSSLASLSSRKDLARVRPHLDLTGFKTEPGIFPQQFGKVFKIENESLLSPGYIFLAMMKDLGGHWGPQVYDYDGNIVWYGHPFVDEFRIADFHVCDYMGIQGTHLCWHERKPNPAIDTKHPLLQKVVVDDTYSLLHNHSTRGDGHEFQVVDNGSRFVTMDYKRMPWDLRPYCGIEEGYIRDACIVEYDIQTGEETWDWCFTDHLPVYESMVYFIGDKKCQYNVTTPKAGRGTFDIPWDFGHLNAVDKNSEGDYIASFRHLDEIMKIAGPDSSNARPGTILWRLGGNGNQFEKSFEFSRQHMIRYVNESREENTTTIALFNNAWEGILDPVAESSTGQIIEVNTKTMKARLLHEYPHPHSRLSGSRGSMQVLPNGNAYIGWGNLPEISEYTANGTLVFHAQFAPYDVGQYSYRSFKFPWVGRPRWPPKLVPYSYGCKSTTPLFAYVSWNGHTEVRKWRFYTAITAHGPWIPAGEFVKDGFETRAELSDTTAPWVSVSGLDANGNVLGSTNSETFIPHLAVKHKCNTWGCVDRFVYNAEASRGQSCDAKYTPALLPLLVLILFLECSRTFVDNAIRRSAEPGIQWLEPTIFDVWAE